MITLEVSSTDIRLMEIDKGRVLRWASYSLGPAMFEEEVVADPRALSTAVKQLMTSSGIKGRNVTASVGGLYSVSRIVMVPGPSGGAVSRQAVLEGAREVMPLPEDEVYLSWQTVASGEGGHQVMVVTVPRDIVDGEVQALRAAGVNPRIVELKAMALIRAVNREQALILNIEPATLDVVLVVDGVAEVMRTTAWQPEDLSVEDSAEHLAMTLELIVSFYNSHHPGLPLDPATPVFITGQMSGDLDLMEKLQARVGYPVEPLAPPLDYPAHLPVSQYAVNIGLALRGTAAARSPGQSSYLPLDINLLPRAYRPWKPSARQIYFICAVVAAIALLLPLYQVTSEAMTETAILQTRYDTVNSELGRRQAELRNREPLQGAIGQYNTIVDMGGGFIEDLEVITSLAEELGIEASSISHGGGSISFTCQAPDYTIFRDYLTALEESGRFSSVTRPSEVFPYIKGGPITIKLTPTG